MANNRGKQFEQKFFRDFKTSFPDGTIDRIYDTTNGYKTISNISDFIGYVYPNILYLECKSHQGNTFPLVNLTQYEKLKNEIKSMKEELTKLKETSNIDMWKDDLKLLKKALIK